MENAFSLDGILDEIEIDIRKALNQRENQEIMQNILSNPEYQREMNLAKSEFGESFVKALRSPINANRYEKVSDGKLKEYAYFVLENSLIKRIKSSDRFLVTRQGVERLLTRKMDELAAVLGKIPIQDTASLSKDTLNILYSQLETDSKLVAGLVEIARRSSISDALKEETFYGVVKGSFPSKELYRNYLEMHDGLSSLMRSSAYRRLELTLADKVNPKNSSELNELVGELSSKLRPVIAVWDKYISKLAELKAAKAYS